VTDAHPTVEMVMMRQPAQKRTALHLINASGQSQNGYFDPITFGPVHIDVAGTFRGAAARRAGMTLPVRTRDGRTSFVLPTLRDYEAIVMTQDVETPSRGGAAHPSHLRTIAAAERLTKLCIAIKAR